jgi:NAD(P)H-dependent FMN reductase
MLICGSTRAGSSNLAALQAVAQLRHPGVAPDLYAGLTTLPPFVPGRPPDLPVLGLLARIVRSDAVVFSTPECAGGLPGTLKNLLDWTVGGGELYGKPVAWLDVANPGRGEGARGQLASVLRYVGAHLVPDACLHLPMLPAAGSAVVDPSGLPALRAAVQALLRVVDARLEQRPSA